ncbi:hypothetical protein [Halomonas sp. GD1P12]|uniref:hypothetical protein n=1 Tax=Halomonas sp. GD1P12 TaxID=2982691 RepID=UPI0021E37060|nr:hypothetical protein [Halomonas sp. GD1P12]UYF99279.1 hypothetical protein OCT39_13730 [Halomonas sp. GD1P12]
MKHIKSRQADRDIEMYKSRFLAAFMRPASLFFTHVVNGERKSRLQALKTVTGAISLLAMAGCSVLESSPIGQAIVALDPSKGLATATQADSIPFASLALDSSTQRGLLVLGAQTGTQTHWPSQRGFLSLESGGLYAASTLEGDLLSTRYYFDHSAAADALAAAGELPWQRSQPRFWIERHWVDTGGLSHAHRAEGHMTCKAPRTRALLLTELLLQPCDVTYTWDNGQTTRAQWWKDPITQRLWEVDEIAWPGGPDIKWQVARPWWDS